MNLETDCSSIFLQNFITNNTEVYSGRVGCATRTKASFARNATPLKFLTRCYQTDKVCRGALSAPYEIFACLDKQDYF
jgi:hypothetical protein